MDFIGTVSNSATVIEAGVTFIAYCNKKIKLHKVTKTFLSISEDVFQRYCEIHSYDSLVTTFQQNDYKDLRELLLGTPISVSYLNTCRATMMKKSDNRVSPECINELLQLYFDRMKESSVFIILIQSIINHCPDDPLFANTAADIGVDIIKRYSDNFTDIMFLQEKEDTHITLENLYVENDYDIAYESKETIEFYNSNDSKRLPLRDFLYNLFSEEKKLILVEGDAGIGKSSLVSRIANDYMNRMIKGNLWVNKKLLIVQLRELNPLITPESQKSLVNNPLRAIIEYFRKDLGDIDPEDSPRFFQKLGDFVLVLDGYDELCLLNDIHEAKVKFLENLIKVMNTHRVSCNILVTSRPNYVDRIAWNESNNFFLSKWERIHVSLNHFNRKKREEWVNNAKNHNLKISEELVKILIGDMQKDVEAVASTPFTMYLISYYNIDLSESQNLWYIYNQIFEHALIEKNYDKDRFGNSEEHPKAEYAKLIIEVTKEIALSMLHNGMNLPAQEVKNCIEKVLNGQKSRNEEDLVEAIKNNYALFNYYRSDGNGGVSFFHNYIQDYFLAEVLFERLNTLFNEFEMNKDEWNLESPAADSRFIDYANSKIEEFLNLNDLSHMQEKVFNFIHSKTVYTSNTMRTWADREKEYHMFGRIIAYNFMNGTTCTLSQYIIPLEKSALMVDNEQGYLVIPRPIDNVSYVFFNTSVSTCEDLISLLHKNYPKYQNSSIIFPDQLPIIKSRLVYNACACGRSVSVINSYAFELYNIQGQIAQNLSFDSCRFALDFCQGSMLLNSGFYTTCFHDVDFCGSYLQDCVFFNCTFENTIFENIIARHARFARCSFKNISFSKSTFNRACEFIECTFDTVFFENTIFEKGCIVCFPSECDISDTIKKFTNVLSTEQRENIAISLTYRIY